MSYVLTPDDLTPAAEPWVITHDEVAKPAAPIKPVKKKIPSKPKLAPPTLPYNQTFESYDVQAEGGQPEVRLTTKDARSMDFRSPEVSIKTVTPELKLKPVAARKREDESFGEYNIRRAQFDYGKKQQEQQAKAERAAVRSKVTPNKFSVERKLRETLPKAVADEVLMTFPALMAVNEAAPTAFGQGIENVLLPVMATGERAGGTGTDYFAQENRMPRLSEADSKLASTKIAEGLGNLVPYGITSALTGTAGTALLGASSNAAQTYEEALAHGASREDALASAVPAALIGSLEGLMGLGTGKFLGQMGKGTAKSVIAGIGGEEFQELTTQTLNNINAKLLSGYDLNRAFSEGLWDTFVTTLGTAGLAHGATMIGSSHSPKIGAMPSFLPADLQQMEQRSLEAGRPVALTPETKEAYTARNQELKQQLMTLDPASPDFARLADEHTRLARAIEEAPTTLPESNEALRQHLIDTNMGHEGAADEMMAILQPPADSKAETGRQLSSRFYPNSSETKGGTVYLSPETLDTVFFGSSGERSGIGAVNESAQRVMEVADEMQESDPTLAANLRAAATEALNKGLTQVSLVAYAKGQGFKETRRLMRHESFHTGQWGALNEAGEFAGPDIRSLHSSEMVYHPVLGKMASSEMGQQVLTHYAGDHDALAAELAAYTAANQGDLFGLTLDESASYLTDYFYDVAETNGPEVLDTIAGKARLSPSVEQKIKGIANDKRAEQQRRAVRAGDFAQQLKGYASVGGGPQSTEGSSGTGEGVDAGRAAESTGQAETGGMDGGTPEGPATSPGPGPDLYTTVLKSDVIKEYAKKAGQAMEKLGWLDPASPLPPHEQLLKVLRERPDLAEPEAIGKALRDAGVTGDEVLQQIDEAAANAGRTLQAIQATNAQWDQLVKEFPKVAAELGKAGLGPTPKQMAQTIEKEVQAAFKDVRMSILGRSLWQRAGDLYRKTLLTRFSTAANNAISTLPRIPLDLLDGLMTGSVMGALQPQKYAGKSDATIAEAATKGALASAQASMRVTMAFPDAARRLFRRSAPQHEFNEMVIAQMEQLHPDLHSKLEGRSSGINDFKESQVNLDKIRELLPYLNDGDKFKQYEAQLNKFQKRYDFNHKWAGKLFNKTNWTYDQFLKPGNVQEFFFRRPYFVGALAKHAAANGYDLSQMVVNTQTFHDFVKDPGGKDAEAISNAPMLADLPPEVWEAAADDALTFTYAYAPKEGKPGVEGAIEKGFNWYIRFMDALGPIGAVVDAFPKAMYNGLKFAYEYSPLGMLRPAISLASDAREGGRAAIKYDDVSRVSKATLGMAMFGMAWFLRREAGGEEWWQIKTGKKDKKGQPIYLNVKKYMPFAGYLYLADLVQRMKDGRMIDKKPSDDLAELYFGARRVDDHGKVFSESLKEISDYWSGTGDVDTKALDKAGKPLGTFLGAPLTPFINLRDLVAQFDEDEAARRDMKEAPILGPSIDKIPWLRSSEKYGLPLYQPPTEPAPQPSSAAPALTEAGISLDPGSNFVTREFSRLGISPIRWLKPDPDPKINRAQYAAYAKKLAAIAPKIETSPLYQGKTDAQKAAFWEAKLAGEDGIAAEAKEIGQQANPKEINRRELLQSQSPLQRRATGLDKKVQEMKNKTVP